MSCGGDTGGASPAPLRLLSHQVSPASKAGSPCTICWLKTSVKTMPDNTCLINQWYLLIAFPRGHQGEGGMYLFIQCIFVVPYKPGIGLNGKNWTMPKRGKTPVLTECIQPSSPFTQRLPSYYKSHMLAGRKQRKSHMGRKQSIGSVHWNQGRTGFILRATDFFPHSNF